MKKNKKKVFLTIIIIAIFIGTFLLYAFNGGHFYGKDSMVNLYYSLDEYKSVEHIDFYDFYDPLEYIVNDKKIHISEYQDLVIIVPISSRDQSCTFHIVHEENENDPTVQFSREASSLKELGYSNKKTVENIDIYYDIDYPEDQLPQYFFDFRLDGILYMIIVEDEHHMFTSEEMFDKMLDYFEMQFKEIL